MYTPKQVSDMLKIPPSTLRRYAAHYSDYLSTEKRSRRRVYNERDIATLEKIRSLAGDGQSVDAIKSQLSVIDTEEPTSTELAKRAADTLALVPSIAALFEDLGNKLQDVTADNQDLKVENQEIKKQLEKEREAREAKETDDRKWKEYHRALDRYDRLPWLKQRRTERPTPPEE